MMPAVTVAFSPNGLPIALYGANAAAFTLGDALQARHHVGVRAHVGGLFLDVNDFVRVGIRSDGFGDFLLRQRIELIEEEDRGAGVFALATLGFLQIVQILIEEFADLTGGVRGLSVPKAALAGTRLSEYARFLIVLGCCAGAIWTARNLLASRVGRELNAVRLSAPAAEALLAVRALPA